MDHEVSHNYEKDKVRCTLMMEQSKAIDVGNLGNFFKDDGKYPAL